MTTKEYLNRINFKANINLNEETLIELHKCHVLSIPFEDLDIHLNRPIKLDIGSIYKKVIQEKRGGFCYELNFLFYSFLEEIGFDCKIVSSRIFDENGIEGPAFDHMSIIVHLQDDWLLDVGYGDLFIEPIKIKDNYTKKDWFKTYRINRIDETSYLLSESKNGKEFKKRYTFDERPRQIEAFQGQCHFKQYSEDSYFVKNKICTLPTKRGRVSLLNDKLIKRVDDIRAEQTIESPLTFNQLLKD